MKARLVQSEVETQDANLVRFNKLTCAKNCLRRRKDTPGVIPDVAGMLNQKLIGLEVLLNDLWHL